MSNNVKSKGITVLTAAAALNFVSGLLYIWSVISKALMKDYHWTSTQASLPYTIAIIVMVIAMIFGGRLQDLKGPRITGTFGAIFLGVGLILCGFVKDPVLMLLTFSVVGIGIAFNSVCASPAAMKWFAPEKKGLISGIVVAAVGLASVMYSPLINALITGLSIKQTFIYLGIAAMILAVILAQFLQNPPQGFIAEKSAPSASAKKAVVAPVSGKEMGWKEMIKSPNFVRLWIMLAFSASAGLMVIGHAAEIALKQAKWEGGFLLVIFLAIFNTAGRLLGGTLSDKIGRVNLLRFAFFIQAANMLLFSQFTSIPLLCVGVGIAGLCYGATFATYPSITADYFGMKNLGMNYAVLQTAWGVGGIIGPMAAASILDKTGSFNNAYLISMVLVLISGIVTFTFRSKQKATNV